MRRSSACVWGSDLSLQADPPDRRVHAGRRRGSHGAHRGPKDGRVAQSADRRREPPRREWFGRHRCGRQGRPGWLHHAAGGPRRARRQSQPISQTAPTTRRGTSRMWASSPMAPYVLGIDPKLEARSLAEFVRLAKEKPGAINYASFGIASMAHLNIESLKARLGIDLTHVPYKGVGPAVMAVAAGRSGCHHRLAYGGHRLCARRPHPRAGDRLDPAIAAHARCADLVRSRRRWRCAGADLFCVRATGRHAARDREPTECGDETSRWRARGLRAPHRGQAWSRTAARPQNCASWCEADIPRFAKLVQDIGIQPE